MKKSNYTVTMPMTDYEQFVQYKEMYEGLVKSLIDCYDTKTHDNFSNEPIRFDCKKAESISNKFLQMKYKNVDVTID